MKSRFLSKAILLALYLGVTAAGAAEFRWPGEKGTLPGERVSGGLRVAKSPGLHQVGSLRFEGTRLKGKEMVLVTDLPFLEYSEALTLACFILPQRRKQNEDLLAAKTESRQEERGFRLFKVWDRWGLDLGGEGESQRIYANTKLVIGGWQHLAAVVNEGQVLFYHDGVPAGGTGWEAGEVRFPRQLAIGSSLNGQLPFQGWITGVYVSDEACDPEALHRLMRSVTE